VVRSPKTAFTNSHSLQFIARTTSTLCRQSTEFAEC
jgi:hypothetical protein